MSEKEDVFIAALRAFLKEHGVRVVEYENYDNDENYAGSNWTFVGEDVYVDVARLVEK